MPLIREQREWLEGVIAGLTALSDNRWMMPSDHLATILNELSGVIERQVTGAVVEMGCAGGRTSLRLAALLQLLGEGPGRPLHLYDSFVGFPELTPEDYPGDTRYENLRYPEGGIPKLFSDWGDGLLPPVIHKGFFTDEDDNPDPIAFAFIDCDVYESLKTALRIVWPRLYHEGTIIVHDYGNPSWPGVRKGCDEFFSLPEVAPQIISCLVRHGTLLTVTKTIYQLPEHNS